VEELPGSEPAAGAIASQRLVLLGVYERDDAEAERVLERVAPFLARLSAAQRADAILDMCLGRPTLAEKHLPPLIAELEEELRANPDMEGETTLAGIKRNLERIRAD
jgi:hypothetical protein